MAELSQKVIIITGASSGIGDATARLLASEGARVAVVARRQERLEALVHDVQEKGGEAIAITADITERSASEMIVREVMSKWSRIDVVINNAGVMLLGPVSEAPLDEWEQMVHLNLLGLLYLTRAALPILHEQKAGHIVNISSVAGRTTRPGSAVYNLTKWGVNAFTDALRQELAEAKTGIRTTLIEPGAVDTELASHIRDEVREGVMQRFNGMKRLESEDIARAISFVLRQPSHVSINEMLIRPTEQAG